MITTIGLCIEFAEMQKCGIARTTMLEWKAPIKINDPSDRRKALFVYDNLKPKYQTLVKEILCDGTEPGEYQLKTQIAKWLSVASSKDKQDIRSFRIAREAIDFDNGEVATKETTGLPNNIKELYLLQSRWLRLIESGFKQHKNELVNLKINNVATYRQVAVSIANNQGAKLPKNDAALRRKLNAYKKNGICGLVSKKWGNTNSQVVNDEAIQCLIDEYGDGRKPTIPMLTTHINRVAKENEWNGYPVTEATVYNNLYRPEVIPAWYIARHGTKAYKEKYEITYLRYKPTQPDVLWVGDDTKVNLYYKKNRKGIMVNAANLNVYAIIDAHSGYWLGWSYIENKATTKDVRDAFRMAVRRSKGRLPMQMQYDGDSSNLFYKRLNTLHFKCMPNNGQSKIIERMFGKLQREFMRFDEAFTGQNIQSKTLQSKVNPEAVKAYGSKDEAIAAQDKWIEVMSNTPGKDGLSPKDQYFSSQNEDCQIMSIEDERDILWEWNDDTITYRSIGLRMIHNKVEHFYKVHNDSLPDVVWHNENIGVQFKVKYNPYDMSEVALYTADERFVALAQTEDRLPMAVADYKDGDRTRINDKLELKKQQKAINNAKRKTASDVANSDAIANGGFEYFDKEILNKAESDLYAEEVGNVDVPIKSLEEIRRDEMMRDDHRYS